MRNRQVRRVAGSWAIVACAGSQFIHTVYGSVVNVALPAISRDLGAQIGSLQWLVSAYVLALASLLTVSGALADRFGRRRTLLAGNLVMLVGAVVCALSTDIPTLIAGRFIQGIGSALIAPAGLALLTSAFPDTAQRAIAIVWWTAVGTVSLAAGPILGGLIVRDLGWQSVFWAGVPLGIVAMLLARLVLRESRAARPPRFDPVGLTLLVALLAGLAFAQIEGSDLGWGSPWVLGAFAVAVVSLITMIPYESRHPNPLVPVTLFRIPTFTAALSTAVLGYLALAGLLFLNAFYLQAERQLNEIAAGLVTIPLALGGTISALLTGHFVAAGRSRALLLISGGLIAGASLALWATEHAPLWTILAPYFVFGLGFGLIPDPISVTALGQLPQAKAGLASSLISTSKQVGQMLGIAGVGTLLSLHAGSQAIAFDDLGGWVWAMLATAGAIIVILNALTPAPGHGPAPGHPR